MFWTLKSVISIQHYIIGAIFCWKVKFEFEFQNFEFENSIEF